MTKSTTSKISCHRNYKESITKCTFLFNKKEKAFTITKGKKQSIKLVDWDSKGRKKLITKAFGYA